MCECEQREKGYTVLLYSFLSTDQMRCGTILSCKWKKRTKKKKLNCTNTWAIYQHVGQTDFIMCVSPAQVQGNFTDVPLSPHMINQIMCNYPFELCFVAEFIITP